MFIRKIRLPVRLKKNPLPAILSLLVVFFNSFGQGKENIRKLDQLIATGRNAEAIAFIGSFSKTGLSDPEVLFLSGKLYASQRNYRLAILFLNQALEKSENPGFELLYLLGDVLHKSNQFAEAAESYSKCLAFGKEKLAIAEKIKQCKLGENLKANPLEVRISNLGININTAENELRPIVSPDFLKMFYLRKNSEIKNSQLLISQNHSSWEKASVFPASWNLDNSGFHFSGISPDGQVIYLESQQGKGDIYFSQLEGGVWSAPKSFVWNSPRSTESSVSISADGNLLFFVSDRSGNKDIWYCNKKGNSWTNPRKAGPEANTNREEESPWLDADGQYLYFSSKGHGGIGGFDIFRVPFGKNGARPENIGYPINSAGDDIHFMLMPDEKTAFYSSERDGGQGGFDIFSVRMSISGSPQLLLYKGSVSDGYGSPVDAAITITETGQSKPVAKLKANPETGTFVTLLPTGKSYSVLVEKEGYLFYSDLLNLRDQPVDRESERKIKLQKLLPGTSLILNNIFFDAGKSSLRKESSPELQRILLILRQNPGIKVEISGHIEAGGPEDILLKLTENRAQAVVDYLVATGIKSSRLIPKGFGSSKTGKEKADSPEQKVARTEFRVISIQ